MKIYILLLTGLLTAAILGGCGQEATLQPQAQKVRTQIIDAASQLNKAEYAGKVVGRYETNLAFQVGGRILARYVDAGSLVQAGDVLMRIDSRDVLQSVSSSQAQVQAADAKLKLAQADLGRYRQLFEQGAVSEAVYDQYRTAYEAALAQLQQANAQYEQSSNSLGYTELTAPSAGVISQLGAESGQVVAAGQTAAILVSDDSLEVEIHVPENQLEFMRSKPEASVSFWALPACPPVRAAVREITPVADSVTRTYRVRLTLLAVPPQVELGMTAQTEFAARPQAAIKIPLTALYQTGDTPAVWTIKEGKAQLKSIVISEWDTDCVFVTDGLSAGDVIITAGVHKLAEGQSVEAMEGEVK